MKKNKSDIIEKNWRDYNKFDSSCVKWVTDREVRPITINLNTLIGKLVIVSDESPATVKEQVYEALENASTRINEAIRQDSIQKLRQRYAFSEQDSLKWTSGVQFSKWSLQDGNIEKRNEIVRYLCEQIRALDHSVRVQDRSHPIQLRKCDPKVVEQLIESTENLIGFLEKYILPFFER